jgi:hypothetical protein
MHAAAGVPFWIMLKLAGKRTRSTATAEAARPRSEFLDLSPGRIFILVG